jgi:hypothetical protein
LIKVRHRKKKKKEKFVERIRPIKEFAYKTINFL